MGVDASKVTWQHADLTDALARGRLALAEVAAIPPRELDALYELGAQCLDTERDAEAADLLGGLVALFPFAAAYWRAYAIALHRCLELERARAAYDAALLLQPDHARTRCYRSEVLLYLGRKDEARAELGRLVSSEDMGTAARAGDLLRLVDLLHDWRPKPSPRACDEDEEEPELFELGDARALPLEVSRFPTPEDDTVPTPREVTNTARIFAPVTEPIDTAPMPVSRQDQTDTAILPRRREAAADVSDLPGGRDDTTETGLPPRHARGTEAIDTGVPPPSGTGEAGAKVLPDRGDPVRRGHRVEDTETDLVPGRARARALAASGEGDPPIATPHTQPESTATDLVPGRARARAVEAAGGAMPPPPSATRSDDTDAESEITHTAIHLRRAGVPLVDARNERPGTCEAATEGHPAVVLEEADG